MRKEASTNVRNERWLIERCPFSLTLEAIGSRWSAAVLWKVLRGEVRFADLARAIPLITEKMLAQTLDHLQSLGLLDKHVRSARPLRVEYAATERGRSLEPVLAAMYDWGEAHRRLVEPFSEGA
jgi:DNA-binding HxlR family transcriptional regulator